MDVPLPTVQKDSRFGPSLHSGGPDTDKNREAIAKLRHKLGRAAKADTTQYSALNKNIKNWLK